jgi:malonyl CoA-acyl carrier protein transacylase
LSASTEERILWNRELAETSVAQPAICFASMLWYERLYRLGITPIAVGGHSLGELTAFYAAKAFDSETLIKLAATRGKAMSATQEVIGSMASLSCEKAAAELIVRNCKKGYVVIANINSPIQTVISGQDSAIEEALALALEKGISGKKLNVSNAFHSELISSATQVLKNSSFIPEHYESHSGIRVVSGVPEKSVSSSKLSLREHFSEQVTSPVDFISLIETLTTLSDIIVEVGPGRVLTV